MAREHPYRADDHADVMPAVRSLRVAAALNDRFGELARPRRYDNPEALANALGEARQIYPEIWSNLDDAHAHLGKLGTTVPEYPQLRATPAARDAGVLDVDVKEFGLGGREKTAHVNAEGHATALAAIRALKAALPEVDWDSLDRADAREIEAVGSLRMARWKMIVLAAIGFVLAATALVVVLYLRTAGREPERNRFEIKLDLGK
jgi:hypothetical protein